MSRENLLTVRAQVEQGVGILYLEGELLAESRYETERILREWCESGIHQVIVSCSGVMNMDSGGLSTLLGAMHRVRREGGDLILAEYNPMMNNVFEQTSVEKFFRVAPTISSGFEMLAKTLVKDKK